jgi:eukaryotic-like serine/threonine-protein kinase
MADSEQRYRIIEKLDSGGMAEIYKGEVESIQGFKKQVAIKRILPHLTKKEKFVTMFLDEARLSLFLNHANIVHVFDIGRSSSTYFIVMEFVDGLNLRTLTESLRRQNHRMEIAKALFILMEICKGLGYAHDMVHPENGRALGIVHRDVSPPNILLSRMGEVKLVDFGLAKAASQVEQTDPGVVKGKFSYLSPEGASGVEVDWRTDIFACGIILFELLTGRRLFYGENDYQTVELVRQARIPSVQALNSEVPAEAEQILRRALARDREQRYQHAYEMQDAIAQLLFSHGMKVTSRDIAKLVRECLAEHRQTVPHPVNVGGNVIDALIQEEVIKFTSLDNLGSEPAGAKPLSPDELSHASGPLDPRDFIDPRDWTNELSDPMQGGRAPAVAKAGAAEPQDVGSLEEFLEGETAEPESDVLQVPALSLPLPPAKRPSPWRGLIIALVVLFVLGGATVFVLYTLGILGSGSSATDNQDIVRPK